MLLRFFLLSIFFLEVCAQGLEVHELLYEGSFQLGEKKTFDLIIYNEKETPEEISLKIYDYDPPKKGGNNVTGEYKESGTLNRSNASWISFPNKVKLGPKERKMVPCQIQVPAKQALSGSYWSRIMIEPADKPVSNDKDGLSIFTKIRYAYAIITHVGTFTSKLKILDKGVTKINENEYFYIELANNSNFCIRPQIRLKLFGSGGVLDKTLEGDSISFYPGCSNRYTLPVKEVKKQKYKAFLTLETGDTEPFADVFDIQL